MLPFGETPRKNIPRTCTTWTGISPPKSVAELHFAAGFGLHPSRRRRSPKHPTLYNARRSCGLERPTYRRGLTYPLNELDRVAVRIGNPRGAQLASEKVMRRGKNRRAVGDQGVQCGIGVVGPQNNFNPPSFSFRTKAVVRSGRLDRRNSEIKAVQVELDMGGVARRRSPKRFNKAQLRIKRHHPRKIA